MPIFLRIFICVFDNIFNKNIFSKRVLKKKIIYKVFF